MSLNITELKAIVTGDLNFAPTIYFREFENGSVEVTLSGHKSNQWHVQNSTTIAILSQFIDGFSIVVTVELPELPCFNDSIRYERCDKGDFSVLYVPIKSIEKTVQSVEMTLDSRWGPEHLND